MTGSEPYGIIIIDFQKSSTPATPPPQFEPEQGVTKVDYSQMTPIQVLAMPTGYSEVNL